jgi:hypothetical protein
LTRGSLSTTTFAQSNYSRWRSMLHPSGGFVGNIAQVADLVRKLYERTVPTHVRRVLDLHLLPSAFGGDLSSVNSDTMLAISEPNTNSSS